MGFSIKNVSRGLSKAGKKASFASGQVGIVFNQESAAGANKTIGTAIGTTSKVLSVGEQRLPEAMALTKRAQSLAQTAQAFGNELMANPMGTPQAGGGGFAAYAPQESSGGDNSMMYILLAVGAVAVILMMRK